MSSHIWTRIETNIDLAQVKHNECSIKLKKLYNKKFVVESPCICMYV